MRDHYYIDSETGARTLVSALPTSFIEKLLAGQLQIVEAESADETVDNIKERLRIELIARQLEGRL